MPRKRQPLAERFWLKVKRGSGCWEYDGARSNGYGIFQLGRGVGTRAAHIVAWELENGPTGGQWVLHRCDNPPCCRPSHLYLGNHADNMADMSARGRSRGSKVKACPAGHPYNEVNTYVDTSGRRRCRLCRRLRRRVVRTEQQQLEMRRRMGAPRARRTHCPAGHPYSEENTYTFRGHRHCRACKKRS